MFQPKLRLFKRQPFNFRTLFHTQKSTPSLLPPPKPPHLSLLADKCTSMNQLKQIHAQMIVSDRIHDNYAASRVVSFCALSDSGNLNYALKVFDTIHEPNSFMFNTMIRAQASTSNPFEAITLYIKMKKLGLIPGKHTFPFVLKACVNCYPLNPGKQIHADVMKFGLELDLYVVNGLIRCYCVCGDMHAARKSFEEVPERKLLIWNAVISGYAQNFCSNEALALFDQMLGEGLEPSGATLSSVLSACARSGSLEMGKQIHVYIKEKGIEVGLILGTALVDMYAKNGEISVARSLFDKMLERNTASWNAMICGLAVHGHAEEAFQLFQEMMDKAKIAPNNVTFVGVLSACCHAGLLEAGRGIFLSMERVYGIEPKIEHYGCMVDLLGRGGKLAEAEELINGMVCEADVVLLGALLRACKDHGNIKLAEKVVRKMLHLEPQNHGVYIVLSNMYADAGSWADVLRLREEMKDGGLKKIPGWSSTDGNKY
ncbi:hypothetical protein MKW94_023006 [Papaver nudicaule]|uniref:Pentatricopeptide repeat-containing protein n=1 Tax=Papaver nudicaule TaxID=74823 RepID=A0AA41V1A9_PAPNU|nr:hypothetical protein [Papaver nudicaule]